MNIKPLIVISHGMGTDSSTILEIFRNHPEIKNAYIPEDADVLVIFSDLGIEFPETYKEIPHQKKIAKELGWAFVHLTSDMGFHPKYIESEKRAPTIYDWWKNAKSIGMVSGDKRCTDRWKINPIWSYVSDWIDNKYGFHVNTPNNSKKALYEYTKRAKKKIKVIIGFAKGEEDRAKRAREAKADAPYVKQNVKKEFPLIDWGMDRKACNDYYEKVLKKKAPRPSNCMMCFFQSGAELVYIERKYPEVWKRWVQLEALKMKERGGNGVRGVHPLPYYLEKAKEKYDDLNDKDLFDLVMYHGCTKGSW
jgi:3'-phosphoadenosine 5'-phosphosulfate sulfotransferase (PAPS reductase)/FAD synthetase